MSDFMTIIDASGLILGRLSSEVSKRLLNGESVVIVNSKDCLISGSKNFIFSMYKIKRDRGSKERGPYFPRMPDMILRRTIRGMLPYKKSRGREAYRHLKVYVGVPDGLNETFESVSSASYSRLGTMKYVRLGDVSKKLGSKF